MNITTYRVPQLMSKRITVICVDGIPICTVRGKKSCSDIIAKLQGYDATSFKDGTRVFAEVTKKGTDTFRVVKPEV